MKTFRASLFYNNRMKKLIWPSILITSSLILSGCGSTSTPATTTETQLQELADGTLLPQEVLIETPQESPCRADYARPDYAELARQWIKARRLWESKYIKNYTYDFQFLGFAPYAPIRITVKAGQAISAEALNPVYSSDYLQYKLNIPQRFNIIASKIIEEAFNPNTANCFYIKTTYDKDLGYPTVYLVDRQIKGLADSDGGWTIFNFKN